MQKLSKISLVLTTAFCGLFCGCYEGIETKCYDSNRYVFLKIISMTDIDSVHFFLNTRRVCVVGLSENKYQCDDSTLKVSENDCPVWNVFSCGLGPLENVDFDSSKMSIEIFIKGDINNIETDFTVIGGNYINVIPEQDTAEWFGYEENPIRPFFDVFDSPASSNRGGCYDGYCVATLPIVKEEFCYDLSN